MNSISPVANHSHPYLEKAHLASCDLRVKKVAISILITLNLGALATGVVFMTLYCPIPAKPVFISTVLLGIMGAFSSMDIKLFGLEKSASKWTNPLIVIGHIATYILFGPTIFLNKKLDWTDYGDPHVAHTIFTDLKAADFDTIVNKYGPHFENLEKYGFLPENTELTSIYEDYKEAREELLDIEPTANIADIICQKQEPAPASPPKWRPFASQPAEVVPPPLPPRGSFEARRLELKKCMAESAASWRGIQEKIDPPQLNYPGKIAKSFVLAWLKKHVKLC